MAFRILNTGNSHITRYVYNEFSISKYIIYFDMYNFIFIIIYLFRYIFIIIYLFYDIFYVFTLHRAKKYHDPHPQ